MGLTLNIIIMSFKLFFQELSSRQSNSQTFMKSISSLPSNKPIPGQRISHSLLKEFFILLSYSQSDSIHKWPSNQFFESIAAEIPTLYEIIKTISYLFSDIHSERYLSLYMNSVKIIESFLQTAIIPVVSSLEAFILQKLQAIVTTFYQPSNQDNVSHSVVGTNQSIMPFQQMALKCYKIIMVWGSVRAKAVFEMEQMTTNSSFCESLQFLINRYGVPNFYESTNQMNEMINKLSKKYHSNLTSKHTSALNSTAQLFYRNLLLQQIKRPYQPLKINYLKTIQQLQTLKFIPIPNIPQLNVEKLYEQLDPIYTTPINGYILMTLDEFRNKEQILNYRQSEKQEFFYRQKHVLKLLGKLIRWGDIEAYLNIVCNQSLIMICLQILGIKGYKSIDQGIKILPEYSSKEFPGKKQFYIEFMKFLDIFGVCQQKDLEIELETPKIREIYHLLRQKKFIFPENLMLSKIKFDFEKAIINKLQRNQIILNKIKYDPEITTQYFNISEQSVSDLIKGFKNFLDDCEDQLYILRNLDDPPKIIHHVTDLKLSINDLELQKELIQEEYPEIKIHYEKQIQRSEQLIRVFRKIEPHCDKYIDKQISLRIFKDKVLAQIPSEFSKKPIKQMPVITQLNSSNFGSSCKNQIFYSSNNSNLSNRNKKSASNFTSFTPKSTVSKGKNQEVSQIMPDSFCSSKQENSFSRRLNRSGTMNQTIRLGKDEECIGTSGNISMQRTYYKNRKMVSERIQQILNGFKNFITTDKYRQQQFEQILTESVMKFSDEKIKEPKMNPSLQSTVTRKSSSGNLTFKECLDISKELIKHKSETPKAFQKIRTSTTRSTISSNPTIKGSTHNTDYQQKRIEQSNSLKNNLVPICKTNPIPDASLGRLINYQSHLPSPNAGKVQPSKDYFKKRQKLLKNNHLEIILWLEQINQGRLFGHLEFSSFDELRNIQLEQKSFFVKPSVKVYLGEKVIPKMQAKSQTSIQFEAELVRREQTKFSGLALRYDNSKNKGNEFLLDLPITLHNFTKYSALKDNVLIENISPSILSSLNLKHQEIGVLRTENFRCREEKVQRLALCKIFQNIQLLYEDSHEKVQVYGIEAKIEKQKGVICQIYLKIEENPSRLTRDKTMTIYGSSQAENFSYLQNIVSLLRYNFSY